ncbi:hypothetical protein BESB_010960 [Besnoitia besnoiti]|uniref:Uncharacterized protein n=1 Tax=Besnoitia besnoiti TaxID=94643 RepID=A0A2A9MMY4_BESBE|nr:hypothetical protein BESB_010960 [Besnoitia besnoiti]PFH38754.1 hypothetical protein BESB_010960 [Besnoitia besnoiti]
MLEEAAVIQTAFSAVLEEAESSVSMPSRNTLPSSSSHKVLSSNGHRRKGHRKPTKLAAPASEEVGDAPEKHETLKTCHDGQMGRLLRPLRGLMGFIWSGVRSVLRFVYRLGENPLVAWGLLCLLVIQEHQIHLLYRGGCRALDALNAECTSPARHSFGGAACRGLPSECRPELEERDILERHQIRKETVDVRRDLTLNFRSQCAYMLMLGMLGGSLLALGLLCQTIGCIVRFFSTPAGSPCERIGRHGAAEEKLRNSGTDPALGETRNSLSATVSTADKAGDIRTCDHGGASVATPVTPDKYPQQWQNRGCVRPPTCDRAQQTDDVLGPHLAQSSGVRTRSPTICEGGPCKVGSDGDMQEPCSPPGEVSRDVSGARAPETFYIGDDEGEAEMGSSVGTLNDDLFLLRNPASGDGNSLVW